MNSLKQQTAALLARVRETKPLIHNMTNYVTVNDCANAVLAIGASPIMADDIAEAGDIASIAGALVLNIGTLNQRTIASMLDAGKRANLAGVPVVFDPVGAGASTLRNETVRRMLKEMKFSIIRGNLSELSFLAGFASTTKGVDASEDDAQNSADEVAKTVARSFGCVAAVTGAVDVISDGNRLVRISNGHPMLSSVTGTGCMTSALVGSFAGAAKPDEMLPAAVGGVASMGIAGELAYAAAGKVGTGSFHIAIIDALSGLNAASFEAKVNLNEA